MIIFLKNIFDEGIIKFEIENTKIKLKEIKSKLLKENLIKLEEDFEVYFVINNLDLIDEEKNLFELNINEEDTLLIGKKKKLFKCEKHDQDFSNFCNIEETLICSDCLDDHNGHDVVSLKKLKDKILEKIKNSNYLETKKKLIQIKEKIKQVIFFYFYFIFFYFFLFYFIFLFFLFFYFIFFYFFYFFIFFLIFFNFYFLFFIFYLFFLNK
jgi:hypothetical protein